MAMAVSISAPLAFATLFPHRIPSAAIPIVSSAAPIPIVRRHSQRLCCIRCAASSDDGEASTSGGAHSVSETVEDSPARPSADTSSSSSSSVPSRRKRGDASPPRVADSTDWISSNLTRRFGLGAGLAWVGVLAFGVISEQVKTRNEVFREEQGTRDVEGSKEVSLANGIRYTELREGGGSTPQRGDLVVVNLTGRVASTGDVFVDTTAQGKRPVAFIFGARPYSGGMCDGLEAVLRSTRVGGKRRVTIPAALAFGDTGTTLNTGVQIPGNAVLEYVVELQKASIAPS